MTATIVVNGKRVQCTDLATNQLREMIADGLGWVVGGQRNIAPMGTPPSRQPRKLRSAKPAKSRRRH